MWLHLGHGGRVSVLSSNTTTCPQFLQVYAPFPGFSPVLDITSCFCVSTRSRLLLPGASSFWCLLSMSYICLAKEHNINNKVRLRTFAGLAFYFGLYPQEGCHIMTSLTGNYQHLLYNSHKSLLDRKMCYWFHIHFYPFKNGQVAQSQFVCYSVML